jgi:DNA polymerase-3 subunit delta
MPDWPELAGEDIGPLYGVFGEESFLVGQLVESFLACPAFSTNPSLNVERFLAGDTLPARVLESASTLPFLGPRRLVLVGDFQIYNAARQEEFLAYLDDPSPAATLVIFGSKLDQRTKFAKSFKSKGRLHVFGRLYQRQIIPWLQERSRERGKKLAPAAAEYLSELSGLGLGALDSELEKLALYVGKSKEIGMDQVREATGASRLYSIWDFTDALAGRRLHGALTALDQLIALGEHPVRVLAMVVRLYRQLSQVRDVLDSGGGEREVQSSLRTPRSATLTLLGRARTESAASLEKSLARILATDVALKSSPASERTIMENLVMDLCAG